MIFEYVFIFGKFLKFYYIGGMLMWLDFLVSTTKRTYNHSMWNLIFKNYFFITKLFLSYFNIMEYIIICLKTNHKRLNIVSDK
jgi:hypothetical protein